MSGHASACTPEVLVALKSQSRSLALPRKRLRHLPLEACQLTFIVRLDLSSNRLQELPQEMESLQQLQLLNLASNEFESLPGVLGSLTRLQTLNLFHNRLRQLEPSVLSCLSSLNVLNANENELECLPPEICRLQCLTTLAACRNRLEQLPAQACALPKLQTLLLAYNRLEALPLEMGCLTELQTLQVQRNHLSDLPESLCRLQRLRYLDIACNNIHLLPTKFGELTLREFYYEHNPLITRDPVHSVQEEEALTLKELSARAVMRELRSRTSPLRQRLKLLPEVRQQLSQCSRCAVCGDAFLNTWLECIRFVPFSQPGRVLKLGGLHQSHEEEAAVDAKMRDLPVRALICSYKCFNQQSDFFGLAFV